MPLTFMRIKQEVKPVTDQQIATARSLIEKGITKRAAAKAVGISESALRKRLNRRKAASSIGRKPTFNADQEAEIVTHCKKMYDANSGLTMVDIRRTAFQYAAANKIKNRFDESSKQAGPDWARSFVFRHPELKLLRPAAVNFARDKDNFQEESSD
ncbi:uncharacterized protein LOC123868961 [Maniola jurtina]|uniref:uncharacterized protein LOC123868961 n=1 Tax=Maniola jurtina TaxID=191418 RepID=UPI001E685D9B|nr:uncharacterized protein LOC123868961 [Maniola jurtina]